MTKDPLETFLNAFRSSFHPPVPKFSASNKWLVSKVWSDYMRAWLKQEFARQRFELPHKRRKRLDAALWVNNKSDRIDIALEWEWDHRKVHSEFPKGDFTKVLEVDALSGLAIVHTREDGRKGGARGTDYAQQTVSRICQSNLKNKIDNRPVGLMEIRRTLQNRSQVEFRWRFHDLNHGEIIEGERWTYQLAIKRTPAPKRLSKGEHEGGGPQRRMPGPL